MCGRGAVTLQGWEAPLAKEMKGQTGRCRHLENRSQHFTHVRCPNSIDELDTWRGRTSRVNTMLYRSRIPAEYALWNRDPSMVDDCESPCVTQRINLKSVPVLYTHCALIRLTGAMRARLGNSSVDTGASLAYEAALCCALSSRRCTWLQPERGNKW